MVWVCWVMGGIWGWGIGRGVGIWKDWDMGGGGVLHLGDWDVWDWGMGVVCVCVGGGVRRGYGWIK